MAARIKPPTATAEPSPTSSALRGVNILANAVPTVLASRSTAENAAPSIATLTDDQAMQLGREAGQLAFQAAIDSGVPVPMKVGARVISVVRFQRDG